MPLADAAGEGGGATPVRAWRREHQRPFDNLDAALAWALPLLQAKPAGVRRVLLRRERWGSPCWSAASPQALRDLARERAGWTGAPPPTPVGPADTASGPRFTPHQRAVIDHLGAPAVVVAVAGAGKTTTLIERVRVLVSSQRVAPQQLLLLSFSRAAVANLRAQLSGDPSCSAITATTFHSLAYRLRQLAARLGGDPLPASPPPELLVQRVREHALRAARQRNPDLASAWQRVDLPAFAAYRGRSLAVLAWPHSPRPLPHLLARLLRPPPDDPNHPDHPTLLQDFERQRLQLGWCDHDQSLVEALTALHTQPALLEWARNRYQAVIVDEAQDLSPVQLHTLEVLFAGRREVMLVGDDDQSIYAFRGATPGSLRRYAEAQRARVLPLPDAFRCRAEPLAAAATLMQAGGDRWGLQPRSVRGAGGELTLSHATDPAAEALAQIDCALSHTAAGRPWGAQAVLVRLFAQAPEIEQAAWRLGVPVRLEGAASIPHHPQVLAAWAGVALALGLAGDQPAARERAWRRWLEHAQGWARNDARVAANEVASRSGAGEGAWLAAGRDRALANLLARIAGLTHDPAAALLAAGHTEAHWPSAPHPALAASAERLRFDPCDTPTALERARRDYRAPPDRDALLITSVHRAKGLEWPVVHVPGMNAGSFPLGHDPEERRLAYVAWTRARDHLHLYHHQQAPPSPFIAEGEVEAIAALARDYAFWRAQPQAPTSLASLWYRREARQRFGTEPR